MTSPPGSSCTAPRLDRFLPSAAVGVQASADSYFAQMRMWLMNRGKRRRKTAPQRLQNAYDSLFVLCEKKPISGTFCRFRVSDSRSAH